MGADAESGHDAGAAIVLADDHAVVRSGLRMVLDREPGFHVVGEAGDVPTTVELLADRRPDVLVLDLHMGQVLSLHAMDELRAASPHTRIVILTMQKDAAFVREAMRAGAVGYVVKEAADSELVDALHLSLRGGTYVSPQLGARLVEPAGTADPLSPREVDVLRLIGLGYTNKEVAEQLYLSIRTVESHRRRIQEKLGATTRRGLVRYALEHGLVQEAMSPGAESAD